MQRNDSGAMSCTSYHNHVVQAYPELWMRARGGLYVTVKAIMDKFIKPQFIKLQCKCNMSVNFNV